MSKLSTGDIFFQYNLLLMYKTKECERREQTSQEIPALLTGSETGKCFASFPVRQTEGGIKERKKEPS